MTQASMTPTESAAIITASISLAGLIVTQIITYFKERQKNKGDYVEKLAGALGISADTVTKWVKTVDEQNNLIDDLKRQVGQEHANYEVLRKEFEKYRDETRKELDRLQAENRMLNAENAEFREQLGLPPRAAILFVGK